jgi:hypothetical protein
MIHFEQPGVIQLQRIVVLFTGYWKQFKTHEHETCESCNIYQ